MVNGGAVVWLKNRNHMNDEGIASEGLCSKSIEGLHVGSNFSGTLGLEGDLLSSGARARNTNMDGEANKSASKRRSKIIQVQVNSDGDDEPIGSLFKLKKPRNPKRAKPGLNVGEVEQVEIRAEESMVGGEDMDDTLASFRKKLKGPKMGKNSGSGRGKVDVSVLREGVLLDQPSSEPVILKAAETKSPEKLVEESPATSIGGLNLSLNVGLKNRSKGRGRKPRAVPIPEVSEDLSSMIGRRSRSKSSAKLAKKIDKVDSGISQRSQIDPVVQNETLETHRSGAGTSTSFGSIQGNSVSCLAQELASASEIDVVRCNDSKCYTSTEGIRDNPEYQSEKCGEETASTAHLENYTEIPGNNDNSNQLSYGASDEHDIVQGSCTASVQRLTGETQRLQCGLKQCTKVKDSDWVHDVSGKLRIESEAKLMQSNAVHEVCCLSLQTPVKETLVSCSTDDQLTRSLEETCKENIVEHSDCLNQPSGSTFCELSEQVEQFPSATCETQNGERTRSTELVPSVSGGLESSLMKLEDIRKPQDEPDQSPEMFSKDQHVQLHPSSYSPGSIRKEGTYSPYDLPNKALHASVDCYHDSISMRAEDTSRSDCGLSPATLLADMARKSDSFLAVDHRKEEPATFNQFSDGPMSGSGTCIEKQYQPLNEALKVINVPNGDSLSVKEEPKETCSASIHPEEIYPDDAEETLDRGKKDEKLSLLQRAMRKIKKRRHGDMAYEGDNDWQVLMCEQGLSDSNRVYDGDRPSSIKDKSNSPSLTVSAADGGAAAVAAGLKARAAGPVEKIKFKEVLRRRGGLQEYLECRNLILGLWSKDMTRILPLKDCGVTDVPSKEEIPRASLIREIYSFLDQSGYINIGVASEKGKADPHAKDHYKLSDEKILDQRVGPQVADSEDGVAFILGQVKYSENHNESKNNLFLDDAKLIPEATDNGKPHVQTVGGELSTLEPEELLVDNGNANGCVDALSIDTSSDIVDGGPDTILATEPLRDSCGVKSAVIHSVEVSDGMQCNSENCKRIIVVGAGPAGLTAARHLQRQGFSVTVLEARNRMGGRVYTDRSSLSVPVDLGASIITGVEADVATERRPDPSTLVCAQLGLELTLLNSGCPLYDIVTGQKVPADLDDALEAEYNSLLDDMLVLVAQKGELAMRMSLEDGLEYALRKRRMARPVSDAESFQLHTSVDDSTETTENQDKPNSEDDVLSPLERRVMDWHFAHLEYGCATMLKSVSLPYWNQDEFYGGFGGAHCMIKGGYSTVIESLGKGVNVLLNHVVKEITYRANDSGENCEQWSKVKVSTSNGSEFVGDAVLITVPLGCLKADTIKFSPALPDWKKSSIQRLGFGVLNKVVLEFPEVFWDDTVDYFGVTAEEKDRRGQYFMFWNVKKTVGAPVLIVLVVGKAALDGQNMSSFDHVNRAVRVLRKLFGEALVPDPVASVVTNWGMDPFSQGAYSYVAVGSSGEDYDILGRPVENCLFFAGEATCKEYPDTVGGAMLSGLREAVRIIDILSTGNDYTAEVEAMAAAQRQLDTGENELRDMLRRLEAFELSGILYKSSLDGAKMLTKEGLLKDMFFSAKTNAGRLHLVKELLNLPVEVLKSFAGTKEGLSTLNSWILDSMGKDGTQLLRHCVRLLVRVSTDLLAVRLSGIGKTVKEKVCVHTSRDIRAVASQLVSMWIEVFRKEKATNGGLKLLRQATALDSSKAKAKSLKDSSLGKPSLRNGTEYRGGSEIPSSGAPSNINSKNNKKMNSKPSKLELVTDSKSEVSSRSEGVVQGLDSKVEDSSVAVSEEEAAAFAAAEAARAAALEAAKAYASSEADCSTLRELPKIPSFHKFARREQYAQMDESELRRKKWSGGVLGRQDCISEIDSRNCRVKNWSVDFSATCANLDGSKMSGDNYTQRSYSNEVAYQQNLGEHSGESVAIDSNFSKAWVDTAGSGGVKDSHAIERWQSQAAAADYEFYHSTEFVRDEEDSNTATKLHARKGEKQAEESSASRLSESKLLVDNQRRGVERIKQAVADYVASLLMPLYKARKIDKEGYKSIMKKSATKVMEQATDAEKAMTVSEFLDLKRRNKIRPFVDKLIERHMAMKPVAKS